MLSNDISQMALLRDLVTEKTSVTEGIKLPNFLKGKEKQGPGTLPGIKDPEKWRNVSAKAGVALLNLAKSAGLAFLNTGKGLASVAAWLGPQRAQSYLTRIVVWGTIYVLIKGKKDEHYGEMLTAHQELVEFIESERFATFSKEQQTIFTARLKELEEELESEISQWTYAGVSGFLDLVDLTDQIITSARLGASEYFKDSDLETLKGKAGVEDEDTSEADAMAAIEKILADNPDIINQLDDETKAELEQYLKSKEGK